MDYAVIAASSPFCLRAKMLTHSKNDGPFGAAVRVDQNRGAYPFVSGAINDVALTPSASAWKLSTTRWLKTGSAIAATSSMSGIARPSIAARALAPRIRYCDARGPAPQLTYFFTFGDASGASGRVERASFTAWLTMLGAAGRRRTRCSSSESCAPVSTGDTDFVTSVVVSLTIRSSSSRLG